MDQDTTQNKNEEEKIEEGQEADIEKLKRERDENLAGWQRARADYLNFQKEERGRFEEFRKMGLRDFVTDLLVVLDSFDAAWQSLKDEGLIKELGRVEDQMRGVLKRYGVEEIAVAVDAFPDLMFHEAIEVVEAEKTSGTIVGVMQKGYTLHGNVIRTTKVKVVK
ncbi:MAG: nucleotide exchange factor GrpE [Parcubacteria group bacterium]|nr:nucleotide exchange factor GrpE [Parcubacteria group bacterium]